MFQYASDFAGDVSQWNVASVTDMAQVHSSRTRADLRLSRGAWDGGAQRDSDEGPEHARVRPLSHSMSLRVQFVCVARCMFRGAIAFTGRVPVRPKSGALYRERA